MCEDASSQKKVFAPPRTTLYTIPMYAKSTVLHQRWMSALMMSVVVMIALTLYAPSISHGFINTDDDVLIETNRTAHGLSISNLITAWTTFDPELYVPVTTMSFQLQSHLFGSISPSMTHAIAIILHAIIAASVSWISWSISRRLSVGFLAGFLFAIHPINAEAVLWASSRKDLLATLFCSLSIVLWLRDQKAIDSERIGRGILFSFALSVLAKPSTALLPLAFIGIDVLKKENESMKQNLSEHTAPRKRVLERVMSACWQYRGMLLISAFVLIVGIIGKRLALQSASMWDIVLIAPQSLGLSVLHIFAPWKLTLFYPYEAFQLPLFVIGMTTAVLGTVLLQKGDRTTQCAVALSLALFIPSLGSPVRNNELYITADHYMYGAMIGISLLLANGVLSLRKDIRCLLLIGCVPFFTVQTNQLVKQWSNTTDVYQTVLEEYPHHFATLNNLGVWQLEHGDAPDAIMYLRRALSEKPDEQKTKVNLAAAHVLGDDIVEAMSILDSVPPDQRDASYGFVIAQINQKKGNIRDAINWYMKVLNQDPTLTKAWNNLGVLYLSLNEWQEAEKNFRQEIGRAHV